MLILDAISQGFGNQMDKLGGALSDPMSYMADILDDNEILAMMQDPKEYEKYLAQRVGSGKKRKNMMPTGNYSDVPMAPVGGFIRNNPNFMNTDQLILSGIY